MEGKIVQLSVWAHGREYAVVAVADPHGLPGYAEFDSGVAQKFVIDSHGDGAQPDEGTVIQRRAIWLPGRR
jgi:hypothetical protein